MSEPTADVNAQVSHDIGGRVLTGVGGPPEALETLQDRYEPEPAPSAEGPPAAPVDGKAPDAAPASDEPRQTRGQKRFADLTRERDAAREEAAAAKAERETLARERDELKARQPQPPAQTPAAQQPPPPAPSPTRAEPSIDEIGTKYDSYEAFTRDQARWVLEQARAEDAQTVEQRIRDVLAQERARNAFVSAVQGSQERARKAYPDFETLLNGPAGQVPLGRTPAEAVARVKFIADHPQSEHIQYAILKDAALAQRLQASPDVEFGVTIAGLVPAGNGHARGAWTPPPKPPPVVGAASPTVATPSGDLASKGFDFDASGYRAKRAAERGVKSRY